MTSPGGEEKKQPEEEFVGKAGQVSLLFPCCCCTGTGQFEHASHEATALHVNLEAAAQIARQIVLRNLNGLIAIDFIDMTQSEHTHGVAQMLKDALQT